MEFTLVFERSNECDGGSFDLAFEPSPAWTGKDLYINLNPENPRYQVGSLKRLIDAANLHKSKKCLIVVHTSGYGDEKDLDIIKNEMGSLKIKFKSVILGEL